MLRMTKYIPRAVLICASALAFSQAHAVASFQNGMTWDWQISGDVDPSRNVDVMDVDLFNLSASEIRSIQNTGKLVTCYLLFFCRLK